jgi:hypothetical protein
VLSRRAIYLLLPLIRVGSPPGVIVNLILLILTIGALALSLWTPEQRFPSGKGDETVLTASDKAG